MFIVGIIEIALYHMQHTTGDSTVKLAEGARALDGKWVILECSWISYCAQDKSLYR